MSENEKLNWMKEAINLEIKHKRYNELSTSLVWTSKLRHLNWENIMNINRKERRLIFL